MDLSTWSNILVRLMNEDNPQSRNFVSNIITKLRDQPKPKQPKFNSLLNFLVILFEKNTP